MRSWVLVVLLLWACPAAALTRATALATTPSGVTLLLDGPATARVLALANPMRLVVDLAGVDAARAETGGSGPVTGAKIGQFDATTARLVISLQRPMRVGSASIEGRRLTLRLAPATASDFAAAAKRGRVPLPIAGSPDASAAAPAPAAMPTRPAGKSADFDLPDGIFGAAPKVVPSSPAQPSVPVSVRSGRKPLVVVDAGHGGKDVGAIAFDGGYEKNVTLAIARMVAKTLTASGKVRVKLTRGDDVFIPLGGRVAIARAARADLFISIHADSAPNELARGASVYTLSDTASDAVAARLAARENKADIIGGVNLGVEAPEVGDIMIALLRRSTLNTAIAFAETLQSSLDDRIPFRGEFHHFAGFLVLKAADVPSVLLETGYVSNADDARFLFSKKGQRVVGEGIARAIEQHFTGSGVRE